MGLRIHRAIGWGMPWGRFLALAKRPLEPDPVETLADIFGAFSDEAATIPRCRPGDAGIDAATIAETPRVPQRRLLARSLRLGASGIVADDLGPGTDLHATVSNVDGGDAHILFFPTAAWRRRWYRTDDDLDWAFSRHDGEGRLRDATGDNVRYVDEGHHPYRSRMSPDGTPIDDETEDRGLPAVPEEIRWFLRRLDLLDAAGIVELRPAIAEWWR